MSYSTAAAKAREYARAMYGQNDYRHACSAADALERAAAAEQTNRVVISGAGRDCPPIEVVGIDRLDDARRDAFLAALAEPKACAAALYALDGSKATVTRRGRWIIDLARPADILAVCQSSRGYSGAPSAPVTNNHGTWAIVLWSGMPAIPALAELQGAVADSLRTTGMTPGQCREERAIIERRLWEAESTVNAAIGKEYSEILSCLEGDSMRAAKKAWGDALRTAHAAGSAAQKENPALSTDELVAIMLAAPAAKAKADREAAEMAALEAEIAAEEAAKAKAAAEAKAAESARIAAEQEAKTAAMLGLSPAEWQAMSDKKRRLALHNARRMGKI